MADDFVERKLKEWTFDDYIAVFRGTAFHFRWWHWNLAIAYCLYAIAPYILVLLSLCRTTFETIAVCSIITTVLTDSAIVLCLQSFDTVGWMVVICV